MNTCRAPSERDSEGEMGEGGGVARTRTRRRGGARP
jgi:hypothetical protein